MEKRESYMNLIPPCSFQDTDQSKMLSLLRASPLGTERPVLPMPSSVHQRQVHAPLVGFGWILFSASMTSFVLTPFETLKKFAQWRRFLIYEQRVGSEHPRSTHHLWELTRSQGQEDQSLVHAGLLESSRAEQRRGAIVGILNTTLLVPDCLRDQGLEEQARWFPARTSLHLVLDQIPFGGKHLLPQLFCWGAK